MSIERINPAAVAAPAGTYSHGVSARGVGRTLYVSGQIGIDAEGKLADGFASQVEQCMKNIIAVLEADGMTVQDLVKLTTFLTDMSNAAELGRIRAAFLDGARPASTLVGTSGLVRPEWLVEIEAVAFKAG